MNKNLARRLRFLVGSLLVVFALKFLAFALAMTEGPCESRGGNLALGRSDHCTCAGFKLSVPNFGSFLVTDTGSQEACIGWVQSRWRESKSTLVYLDVDPISASVLIKGANLHSQKGNQEKQIFIDKVGPYPLRDVVPIDRSYEFRDGKFDFQDKSPLQIEVSNVGYAPQKFDLVVESDPVRIKVKLEPDRHGEKNPGGSH